MLLDPACHQIHQGEVKKAVAIALPLDRRTHRPVERGDVF
jgi:hypothetical protein